jgi:hypothetical protein
MVQISIAEKNDRMKGKKEIESQKNGQKKCDGKASIAYKKIYINFIFCRLCLTLLKHLA